MNSSYCLYILLLLLLLLYTCSSCIWSLCVFSAVVCIVHNQLLKYYICLCFIRSPRASSPDDFVLDDQISHHACSWFCPSLMFAACSYKTLCTTAVLGYFSGVYRTHTELQYKKSSIYLEVTFQHQVNPITLFTPKSGIIPPPWSLATQRYR